MATETGEHWTTRKLQAWMSEAFGKAGVDSPRFMAEMLLEHVLGCERLSLYTDADRPASPSELATLRDLAKRALRHEPVQYLVGEAWFYGLKFRCDRRGLVPRACTEVIVQRVIEDWQSKAQEADDRPGDPAADDHGIGPLIGDVCTGSGCIAIALAKSLGGARVIATDISREALALAGENAELLGVADRVDLREGNLLEPIGSDPELGGGLDYLVANPPYIPDCEWDDVASNVKDHEPTIALRGGSDGMEFVGPILDDGPALLKPGGRILVEVALSLAEVARDRLAGVAGMRDVCIHRDQDGLLRVVEGVRG